MYIKRNNYTHTLNESTFRYRILPQYAENNVLIGTKYTASLQGMLTGTDASDLSTQWSALEAAYASTAGDMVLLQNDGSTETSFKIQGSKTVGGIRCLRLEAPMQGPGEFSTFLRYEIDIEADAGGIGLIGGGQAGNATVISWSESLTFRGTGGPRFVMREIRNGPPQKQIVSQRTPVYASQRGEGVGLYNYPQPAQPIWPNHEMQPDRDVQRTTANSVGGQGNQQQRREYRISWNYSFLAPGQLTANPSLGF
jgi:hypothetical protein